jgi:hypothetical protein
MLPINYPVKIPYPAIPEDLFWNLNHHLYTEGWHLSNSSGDPAEVLRSWGHRDLQNLIFYECASYLTLKMKKHLKEDISLFRILTNGQTLGQISHFHIDSVLPDAWTVVLFTELQWDVTNGGEFVLYNPITKEYTSSAYLPNTAAFFPADWHHKGSSPLTIAPSLRTSLALTYCKTEKLDLFMKEFPSFRKFLWN